MKGGWLLCYSSYEKLRGKAPVYKKPAKKIYKKRVGDKKANIKSKTKKTMKMKLNLSAEQTQMFTDNQDLIHKAIHVYMPYGDTTENGFDYDDLFQIGSLALCKAIKTYKTTRTAFSTYAMSIIRNELYNAIRERASEHRGQKYSLNDEESSCPTIAVSDGMDEIFESAVYQDYVKIIEEIAGQYGSVVQKGVQAIILMSQNYTTSEIAEKFNVESNAVTSWISRARKYLKKDARLLAFVAEMK